MQEFLSKTMVSATIFRYGLALLIFAHGVGHVVGFWGETRHSWALSGILSENLTWAIEAIWMLVTTVLFLGVVLGLLGVVIPHDGWRTLATIASVVSLAGIVVFWGTWPGGTMFFALVFDIALLIVVVWYGWPTEEAIGF